MGRRHQAAGAGSGGSAWRAPAPRAPRRSWCRSRRERRLGVGARRVAMSTEVLDGRASGSEAVQLVPHRRRCDPRCQSWSMTLRPRGSADAAVRARSVCAQVERPAARGMPYQGSVSSIARLGGAHEGGHPPGAAGRRQAVYALLRGQDRKRSTGGGDFSGASLLLMSGRILTMDAVDTVTEALAVQGEHIAAVGTDQQVLELASSGTEVVDLRGRTVVPGFIDAHAHVELGTFAEHFWLDLRDIPLELAKDRIAERVSAQPPGPGSWGRARLGRSCLHATSSTRLLRVTRSCFG